MSIAQPMRDPVSQSRNPAMTMLNNVKKSVKHWGPRRNGGGKVVGVVPTKFYSNWIKITKACYWGGFRVGGVG